MSKTVHYINGCAWANGQLQLADTNQTDDWSKVTCKHCRYQSRFLPIDLYPTRKEKQDERKEE